MRYLKVLWVIMLVSLAFAGTVLPYACNPNPPEKPPVIDRGSLLGHYFSDSLRGHLFYGIKLPYGTQKAYLYQGYLYLLSDDTVVYILSNTAQSENFTDTVGVYPQKLDTVAKGE